MKKETILLHPENPYFNVNLSKSRNMGNVTAFLNNIIGLSRLSDIAVLRKDRNHTNPDWFVKQVANW
jgi:hypothetical protein